MWLEKIKISNFRNYDVIEVIFEKGINYLFGTNGVGKTNLIEAIYFVSNLESFRVSDDRNLIKDLKGEFSIEAMVDGINYSLLVNKDSKLLSVEGIVYKKYRDYLGKVNVVEFCPEEVYLLKDFPKDRRRFLDREISKIDYDYLSSMLVYNKLIKQRNDLLKSDDGYKDELMDVIDDKISEIQVCVIEKRKKFLEEIEKNINDFNTSLNKMYGFKMVYECSFEKGSKENIFKKYRDTREKDKEKKITGLGVHKDDFKIYIDNNEASNFGSQGEQRFIVLLMKLALVNLVRDRINKCPIVVLDDVFSELDAERKKELQQILKSFEQIFITGCNMEDIDKHIETNCYEIKEKKIYKVEGDK